MKLNDSEKLFIKETCLFYTDKQIAYELSRIRSEMGIKDSRVSERQVQVYRYNYVVNKKPRRKKDE